MALDRLFPVGKRGIDWDRARRQGNAFNEAQAANEAEQRDYEAEIERRLSSLPGMRLRLVGRWLIAVGGVAVALFVRRGLTTQLLSDPSPGTGEATPYDLYVPIPFILGALWAWAFLHLSRAITAARSKLQAEYPPPTDEDRANRLQAALDDFKAKNP